MITLYGISNCNTVKKAKTWLEQNNKAYQFHDFRKDGITADLLDSFEAKVGWELLLNKRSTSWRQLSEKQQVDISRQTALQFMLETPTLIKRPVLDLGTELIIGFKATDYQQQL